MAIFDVLAVLMVLAATFGWVNDRYVRLPSTVGIMAMGLTLSLALIALSLAYPPIKVDAARLLAVIDFGSWPWWASPTRSSSCSSGWRCSCCPFRREYVLAGGLAIAVVLLARFVATGLSLRLVRVVVSPAGAGSLDEAAAEVLHSHRRREGLEDPRLPQIPLLLGLSNFCQVSLPTAKELAAVRTRRISAASGSRPPRDPRWRR